MVSVAAWRYAQGPKAGAEEKAIELGHCRLVLRPDGTHQGGESNFSLVNPFRIYDFTAESAAARDGWVAALAGCIADCTLVLDCTLPAAARDAGAGYLVSMPAPGKKGKPPALPDGSELRWWHLGDDSLLQCYTDLAHFADRDHRQPLAAYALNGATVYALNPAQSGYPVHSFVLSLGSTHSSQKDKPSCLRLLAASQKEAAGWARRLRAACRADSELMQLTGSLTKEGEQNAVGMVPKQARWFAVRAPHKCVTTAAFSPCSVAVRPP